MESNQCRSMYNFHECNDLHQFGLSYRGRGWSATQLNRHVYVIIIKLLTKLCYAGLYYILWSYHDGSCSSQTQNFTDCWIMIMTYDGLRRLRDAHICRSTKNFMGWQNLFWFTFAVVEGVSLWPAAQKIQYRHLSESVQRFRFFFYRLHSLSPVTLSSACRRSYRFTGLFFRSFWLSKKLQCDWMSGNLFYFVILVIRGALKSTKPRVFLRILTQRFFCSVTGWVAKYFTICQVNLR